MKDKETAAGRGARNPLKDPCAKICDVLTPWLWVKHVNLIHSDQDTALSRHLFLSKLLNRTILQWPHKIKQTLQSKPHLYTLRMFIKPILMEISGSLELLSGDCWPLRTSEVEVYIPVCPDTHIDKKRKWQTTVRKWCVTKVAETAADGCGICMMTAATCSPHYVACEQCEWIAICVKVWTSSFELSECAYMDLNILLLFFCFF